MYEIKEIIQGKDYITAIEYLREENRKSLFLRNCRIILSDFSVLHVKEIWKGKVEPSTERNLQDVIMFIQKIFHAPQK